MKKYRVYDNYELDMELLGEGSLDRCRSLAHEREKDTDGECYIIIEEVKENNNVKFRIIKIIKRLY